MNFNFHTSILGLCLLACIWGSCSGQKPMSLIGYASDGYEPEYQYNEPDQIIWLDKELNEISGLAYHQDRDQLLAVNDEKGLLYALDKSTGSIEQKWDIGKKGDYEGLTVDEDKVYIVKSNGKVTEFDLKTASVQDIDGNELNSKNDIEGITIYNHQLILACKEAGLKGSDKDKNYFYSIGHDDNDTLEVFVTIDVLASRNQLEPYHLKDYPYPYIIENKLSTLYPSGITTTTSDHLIVLSAKNHAIAVLNLADNQMIGLFALSSGIHPQPEGICIDQHQVLYIANEAAGGTGRINVYNIKK